MKSFRYLEDDEFLREIDNVRHASPIIEDLCRRLEEAIAAAPVATGKCECPICLASLRADYDGTNESLVLKIEDH